MCIWITAVFILGIGTETACFKNLNFKPLLLSSNLNSYFGSPVKKTISLGYKPLLLSSNLNKYFGSLVKKTTTVDSKDVKAVTSTTESPGRETLGYTNKELTSGNNNQDPFVGSAILTSHILRPSSLLNGDPASEASLTDTTEKKSIFQGSGSGVVLSKPATTLSVPVSQRFKSSVNSSASIPLVAQQSSNPGEVALPSKEFPKDVPPDLVADGKVFVNNDKTREPTARSKSTLTKHTTETVSSSTTVMNEMNDKPKNGSDTVNKSFDVMKNRLETLRKRFETVQSKLLNYRLTTANIEYELPGNVPRTFIPTTFLQLAKDVGKLKKVLEKNQVKYMEKENTRFSDRIFVTYLHSRYLYGPAGMAFSRIHDNTLYMINDGEEGPRDNNRVFVFNSTSGRKIKEFVLPRAQTVKWADMAVAPCSSGSSLSCIYIGDLDENDDEDPPANVIYIYIEPKNLIKAKRLRPYHTIRFRHYGSYSQALMVSPQADIYLVTQEQHGEGEHLYQIINGRAEELCLISLESEWKGPVSATISSSGSMVLLKMYDAVYFYYVPKNNYRDIICDNSNKQRLNYTAERHAEAIAFSPDEMAYYTCNEEMFSPLFRYDRLEVGDKRLP